MKEESSVNVLRDVRHNEAALTGLNRKIKMEGSKYEMESPDGQTNEVSASGTGNSHGVVEAQRSPRIIIPHAIDRY